MDLDFDVYTANGQVSPTADRERKNLSMTIST